MSTQERPGGLTLLAVSAAIQGLIVLVLGVFLPTDWNLIPLVLGLLYFVCAYGLYRLNPWGWILGVVLQIASLLGALISILSGESIGGQLSNMMLPLISLSILFRADFREAFGRG